MNLIQKSLHNLTRLISLSENSITILVLLSMASFPLVQAVARVFGVQGIPGSSVIVQHLTLWIGFLGAIIAARENRLLSLTQPVEIQVNENLVLISKNNLNKKVININRYLKNTVGHDIQLGEYPYDNKWDVFYNEKRY